MVRRKALRLATLVAVLAAAVTFGLPSASQAHVICYFGWDCETDCHGQHCECQRQCQNQFRIGFYLDPNNYDALVEEHQEGLMDCDVDLATCLSWCWWDP